MSYEDKKNIAGETEMLGSDEQNVSRLLSDLKRVDAPKDFDFRLKARIANASPADYRPVRFFPVLKYAVPLALFLLIGAAFVLNSSYDGGNVPVVADVAEEPASPAGAAHINSGRESGLADAPARQPEDLLTAANPRSVEVSSAAGETKGQKSTSSKGSRPIANSSGSFDFIDGSIDRTIRKARDTIGPRFDGSNSNLSRSPDGVGAPRALEFRQVLRNLGIEADFGDSGWTVRSVVKNGIAERSGLLTGDLMVAIDGRPIKTLYDGSFAAGTISVRRDGKVIQIELKTQ